MTMPVAQMVPIPDRAIDLPLGKSKSAISILLAKPSALVCLVIIGVYVLLGLLSLTPLMNDRIDQVIGQSYQPPRVSSVAFIMGTDIQGRSVFWRTLYGTRVALLLTIGAGLLSIGIGTVLGIVAGYFGGWVDAVITWLFTTVSSIPWILMVIAILVVLRTYEELRQAVGDLPFIIIALGVTDWVGLCRLLRGEVLKHRESDYVMAARAAGAGNTRILFCHILPNVLHIIIITFSLSAVGYVQAEVALTFIGIGISSKPSWGRMISDARLEMLRGVWWQLAAGTLAIFIICLALNILGDALRDALDPKLRGRD
jgi:ABC-type dipeptide/oligopeptide/nickel transport system permease subunit